MLITVINMRTAKVISISLPPDMNKELQDVARQEHRTVSELMREALRQYIAMRTLAEARQQGKKVVRRRKLRPADVEEIVDRGRK